MRKPVVEKIRWYSEDAQQRWWSGLPSALKLQELFTTSDDATALMMLSRAALRPTPSACDLLEKAFRQRDPWHGWANELKFFPFRFKGLADTTFVWWCVCLLSSPYRLPPAPKPMEHLTADAYACLFIIHA